MLIATVQGPARDNCPADLCIDTNTLNIGPDWEQVDVFLTEVTWLPGSSTGLAISRLQAEIDVKGYDRFTGQLEVELRSLIGNGGSANPEFQFDYVILATRDKDKVGHQPVRMEPFSNSCSGDTYGGCSNSATFLNSKTGGWNFVGLGLKAVDLHITDGKPVNPVAVYFHGNGNATNPGISASQPLNCGILADDYLPFACANSGMVISSKTTVFDQSTLSSQSFSVASSFDWQRQTTESPLSGGKVMALMLLNKFDFTRNGHGGAPYFAPTYVLQAGCGTVDFDPSVGANGTLYVDWAARWQDRTLVPWAWYDAEIACRRSWLNN